MFIEISGPDGEGDVREGVMEKITINTYPLHTLFGQFGDKTLKTVLRRFQKGYNKLLKKRKEKKQTKKKQPQNNKRKTVLKVHQIQWLDGCLVTRLTPANAAFIK